MTSIQGEDDTETHWFDAWPDRRFDNLSDAIEDAQAGTDDGSVDARIVCVETNEVVAECREGRLTLR